MKVADIADIPDGLVLPQHFNKLKNAKYTYEPFTVAPRFSSVLGNGAATGATGNINRMETPFGVYEWQVRGTQTILVPAFDLVNGRGLNFAQDLTGADGHELRYSPNITTAGQARGKHSYVIGTDKPFFARWKMFASDASGIANAFFGFVRHQAYQAGFNYNDYAAFNPNRINATGARIDLSFRLNGVFLSGFAPSPGTVWTDNTSRSFEVRVDAIGNVRFLLDGAYFGEEKANAMKFDTGDVVTPVSYLSQDIDTCEDFVYQEFECGYLSERGL